MPFFRSFKKNKLCCWNGLSSYFCDGIGWQHNMAYTKHCIKSSSTAIFAVCLFYPGYSCISPADRDVHEKAPAGFVQDFWDLSAVNHNKLRNSWLSFIEYCKRI